MVCFVLCKYYNDSLFFNFPDLIHQYVLADHETVYKREKAIRVIR